MNKKVRVYVCPKCNRGGGTFVTKEQFITIDGKPRKFISHEHQNCNKALNSKNSFFIKEGKIEFLRG